MTPVHSEPRLPPLLLPTRPEWRCYPAALSSSHPPRCQRKAHPAVHRVVALDRGPIFFLRCSLAITLELGDYRCEQVLQLGIVKGGSHIALLRFSGRNFPLPGVAENVVQSNPVPLQQIWVSVFFSGYSEALSREPREPFDSRDSLKGGGRTPFVAYRVVTVAVAIRCQERKGDWRRRLLREEEVGQGSEVGF